MCFTWINYLFDFTNAAEGSLTFAHALIPWRMFPRCPVFNVNMSTIISSLSCCCCLHSPRHKGGIHGVALSRTHEMWEAVWRMKRESSREKVSPGHPAYFLTSTRLTYPFMMWLWFSECQNVSESWKMFSRCRKMFQTLSDDLKNTLFKARSGYDAVMIEITALPIWTLHSLNHSIHNFIWKSCEALLVH